MKKPRRPPRIRPKRVPAGDTGIVLDFHPSRIAPERLEAFREAFIISRGNACAAARAIGMKPAHAKADAWRLVRALQFRVADALELLGVDAMEQARKLAALRNARMPKWNAGEEQWDIFEDSTTQLEATKEINRLRDEYPAKKEPSPANPPVTVIFNTDLSTYKGATYATHQEQQPGSIQEES